MKSDMLTDLLHADLQGFMDNVTELHNRELFLLVLEREVRRAERNSESFSVALVDIDDFTAYVRTLASATVEQVLKRVADIIGENVREVDCAARLSHDLFGLVHLGAGGRMAQGIGERIRKAVTHDFDGALTVSIGVASFPGDGKDRTALLERAVEALQEAKADGKNRIFRFESDEPLQEGVVPRILIVDDDPGNVKLLEALLEDEGYEIEKAYSGNRALEVARDRALDLVLLDVMMPGLDGFEVCRKLKCGDRFLPVVLITVLDHPEAKVKGIEAGADDFIVKPLNREEVVARTRSLVHMRRLNRSLTSIENVLFSLASAVEAKDSYTEGHTQRVAQLAVDLGRMLHLNEQEIESIRFGGILHDVGKIGVPGHILNKPGPLDSDEWEIMMNHTDLGYRICLPLIKTLGPALDVIRHHHEKLSGSGYPDGLKAEEISLPARIMGVVDIFDALTTDRPYRKAMSVEEALTVLREEAVDGKIDMAVVQALHELFGGRKKKIRNDAREIEPQRNEPMASILVVEDNDLNMKLVRTLLTLENFQVFEAVNAEQGIDLARTRKPDLILMDIQLPGMDGLEATRKLKNDSELRGIPVIALTSYAMQGDEERSHAAGCEGYIPKPIDTKSFVAQISRYLPKTRPAELKGRL